MVMVGFLCYRVYEVMYPPEEEYQAPPTPPVKLPATEEERRQLHGEVLPPLVPPRPRVDAPEDVASLFRRNPFWYASSVSAPGDETTVERLDIQLLDIQRVGQGYRARIRTGNVRKWYVEGAPFEEYVLEEIDAEARTVTIYAKRLEERLTLNINQTPS